MSERFRPTYLEWLYLLGGIVLVIRYAWLFDDSFVYFRYIDNFLFLDLGLVYNQGEYVEGYSSPLWLLFLIVFRALHLDYWVIVLAVAFLSMVIYWVLLVRLNRRLSPQGSILNFPLAYLCFNYGVLCYFSSGTESCLVLILSACYGLYILNPSSRLLWVPLALSPLVRHELALALFLSLLWSWVRLRRFPWQGVLLSGFFCGSWLAFRIYYYADLLPNTFYLKNAVLPEQGLKYVWNTVGPYYLLFVLAAGLAAVILLKSKSLPEDSLRLPERLMMLGLAVAFSLYVVKIGGDARHFRYLAFPFSLAVCSLAGLFERILGSLKPLHQAWLMPVLGILVACGSLLSYPPQLDRHPLRKDVKHAAVDLINDAFAHRRAIRHENWSAKVSIGRIIDYRASLPEFEYRGISSTFGCVSNYVNFNRRIVHSLGLTDAILARTEMKLDRPAHKFGLLRLARDLRRIQQAAPELDRGLYGKAVAAGTAPDWIVGNLETIEVLEKKIYNRHDFFENLSLAFTFPERIQP